MVPVAEEIIASAGRSQYWVSSGIPRIIRPWMTEPIVEITRVHGQIQY